MRFSQSVNDDRDTIQVEFDTSETLAGPPTVTLGGAPMTLVSLTGARYRFERTLDGTETEGTAAIEIAGDDETGNTGSASATVTTDYTAPTISAVSATPAALRSGETLTVSFTVDEPLAGVPTVTLASSPLAQSSVSGST